MVQKKGLGRGLGAYFDHEETLVQNGESIAMLDISMVEPNPDQPRKDFSEHELNELANSIKEYGMLQPIIVSDMGSHYMIIAGERRYRASRLLKMSKIPAIIRDYSEQLSLQVALVENLQRMDLNVMEEAQCYRRLAENFSMTQEQIADKVGKSRSAVTNCMRLLNLERRVQSYLFDNKLTMGHGRALLAISNQESQLSLAERIIEDELSVRQTEELVKRYMEPPAKRNTKATPVHLKKLEEELQSCLGTKVKLHPGAKKSKIEIEYYSNDDLDRLMSLLKR